MIGAGFRHRFSESRVQTCKPFGSCRPACWETNGSCEELAAEPGRGEITRKELSSKSLSAPGFRSAFRCSQRSGVSKRSPVLVARAPPTPFVSASPPWRKCCVNVWVFQTPETHKHKQDRRASPDKNRSESVATPTASTRTNVWVFQTPETRKRKRC